MSADVRPGRRVRAPAAGEGLAVVAGAVGVWLAASGLPPSLIEGQPGAAAWPKALALALGALGAALLVTAARGEREHDTALAPVNPAQWPALAGTLAAAAGFLLAWPSVGYLAAAVVAFPVLARVTGVVPWSRALAWGLACAGLTWGLFSQLLGIPL